MVLYIWPCSTVLLFSLVRRPPVEPQNVGCKGGSVQEIWQGVSAKGGDGRGRVRQSGRSGEDTFPVLPPTTECRRCKRAHGGKQRDALSNSMGGVCVIDRLI